MNRVSSLAERGEDSREERYRRGGDDRRRDNLKLDESGAGEGEGGWSNSRALDDAGFQNFNSSKIYGGGGGKAGTRNTKVRGYVGIRRRANSTIEEPAERDNAAVVVIR